MGIVVVGRILSFTPPNSCPLSPSSNFIYWLFPQYETKFHLSYFYHRHNQHPPQVSWIRQKDLHILTVGETSYTNNLKFFPTHPPGR